jgi:MFS family permease
MLCSVIPIYLIREEWKPIDIRRWVKGIESYGRIGMLATTEGLVGFAMGFSAPFYNLFFDQHLDATTTQIGMIFAVGSIASALLTLFTPLIVQRWGRVRTVTVVKLLGIPALILLGMSQNIVWAGVLYVITILLVGGPYPNKGISDPIYSLFAMEVVKERERGTTNGIMHAFVEFPMGIGAGLAGPLMVTGDWQTAYLIGGGVLATAFVLYYLYFVRYDSRPVPVLQPAPAR